MPTTKRHVSSSSTPHSHVSTIIPPQAASAKHIPSSATSPTSKDVSSPGGSNSNTIKTAHDASDILQALWHRYEKDTPQRTKLVDVFMAFLVLVGGVQFLYCVLVGNYPFNAFLSGFGATVGQFVLTASLRMQTAAENRVEFSSISPERAFADYILGSMILHFFCVNFIN